MTRIWVCEASPCDLVGHFSHISSDAYCEGVELRGLMWHLENPLMHDALAKRHEHLLGWRLELEGHLRACVGAALAAGHSIAAFSDLRLGKLLEGVGCAKAEAIVVAEHAGHSLGIRNMSSKLNIPQLG